MRRRSSAQITPYFLGRRRCFTRVVTAEERSATAELFGHTPATCYYAHADMRAPSLGRPPPRHGHTASWHALQCHDMTPTAGMLFGPRTAAARHAPACLHILYRWASGKIPRLRWLYEGFFFEHMPIGWARASGYRAYFADRWTPRFNIYFQHAAARHMIPCFILSAGRLRYKCHAALLRQCTPQAREVKNARRQISHNTTPILYQSATMFS